MPIFRNPHLNHINFDEIESYIGLVSGKVVIIIASDKEINGKIPVTFASDNTKVLISRDKIEILSVCRKKK